MYYPCNFRLSSLPTYYIPKDGPLSSYKEYVSMLPNIDHPEAFGQHPNADITSQIQETRMMFDTLLSLQPQVSVASGGESREDKVKELYNLQVINRILILMCLIIFFLILCIQKCIYLWVLCRRCPLSLSILSISQ